MNPVRSYNVNFRECRDIKRQLVCVCLYVFGGDVQLSKWKVLCECFLPRNFSTGANTPRLLSAGD